MSQPKCTISFVHVPRRGDSRRGAQTFYHRSGAGEMLEWLDLRRRDYVEYDVEADPAAVEWETAV